MITPELIEFIKKEEAKGVSRESIISLLRTQSWTEVDIMEAFDNISPKANSNISPEIEISSQIQTSNIQPTSSLMYKPKSNRKMLLVVIIVLFLGLASGFGYVSGYFTTLSSLFSKSMQTIQDVNTMTFDFNMTGDISNYKGAQDALAAAPGVSKVFNFNMKGSYDVSDKNNFKSTNSFLATSGTFGVGLDFRMVDGLLYVNLTKAPDLGFFSLKPFENKWISFPYKPEDLNSNPLASSMGINNNPISTLTDDQKKHIEDITSKASLIKITKRHLPDMLDGSLSFHFDFDLDKKGIISYAKELSEYLRSLDKNSNQLNSINESDFDKSLDFIKDFQGQAWVGIFDNLPHKSMVSFNFVNPEKPDDGEIKITSNIIYKDWNKPIKVEVPKETTTIEKLMSEVMGGSMFGGPSNEIPKTNDTVINNNILEAKSKSNDATIQSIESALRAQAEVYYATSNNSYAGFCKSKSNYGAYTYAVKLPQGTVYKCNDSSNSWASWSKLSDGKYFCVDSTGISESIVGLPQGTSCPSR